MRSSKLYIPILRLLLLGGFTFLLWWWGNHTGLAQEFTIQAVRDRIRDSGGAGILIFSLLFTVGLLVQIPGLVFVVVAALAWGQLQGALISYCIAQAALPVHFLLLRGIGGSPLVAMDGLADSDPARRSLPGRLLHRLMHRVDRHPVQAVTLIRILLFMSPPANYLLALSPIGLRSFLIGNLIGLPIPLIGITMSFEWFLSRLQY